MHTQHGCTDALKGFDCHNCRKNAGRNKKSSDLVVLIVWFAHCLKFIRQPLAGQENRHTQWCQWHGLVRDDTDLKVIFLGKWLECSYERSLELVCHCLSASKTQWSTEYRFYAFFCSILSSFIIFMPIDSYTRPSSSLNSPFLPHAVVDLYMHHDVLPIPLHF